MYLLEHLLKKTIEAKGIEKKVKSWKEVKCCDKDWTRFNARVHLTIEQEFFLFLAFLRELKIRSLAFELNIESHLLDPQLVSSWSKIFMTLPQRSGLESRGHSVTVGKTILSIGKVSTTDFIGLSYQSVNVNPKCKINVGPIQNYI